MQGHWNNLSRAIESHLGLSFPRSRWKDLRRALTQAAPSLGFDDPDSCLQWILASSQQEARVEALTEYLTIGETHFFRDRKLFQMLEEQILPELISSRRNAGRRLRIWSAGCATGEEPYSIALAIKRAIWDLDKWNVTILATDVNRRFLKKAEQGLYTRWSFRSVPEGIQENYFVKKDDDFEIIESVKRMVKFEYLNLAKRSYPMYANDTEGMDLIFCRNVIMYFSQERQEQVLENFSRCLVDGGWLIVSPTEAACVQRPHLIPTSLNGAVLFRKDGQRQPEIKTFVAPFQIEESSELVEAEPDTEPLTLQVVDTYALSAAPVAWEEPVTRVEPETRPEARPYVEGLQLCEQGRYPEAIAKLQQGLEETQMQESEAASSMYLLSKAYANQGHLDQALSWAEKTVATDKINPIYHYLQASILQELNLVEEATEALRRAVFLDPDFVVAHFALGNLLRLRGRLSESGRHYRNALTILDGYALDEPVPASEGMTAGELKAIVQGMSQKEIWNGT